MALSKILNASVTDSTLTTTKLATPNLGRRNLIINGAMDIDQRNAGAVVTQTNAYPYTLDRWQCGGSQNSKFTVQQSSVAPDDHFRSVVLTSSSAYTVGSNENFLFSQSIEGKNVAHLKWGTASAKAVTMSFWVRSSLTGTFGGSIQNAATDRSYPYTYTISSANTWEYKTIALNGDTSGTWLTTNGVGIIVRFGLGVGSASSGTAGSWAAANYLSATGATSVVGTSSATLYITGVQLEVNSQATPFEHRSFGEELALCQRYYYRTTCVGTNAVVANGFQMAALTTSQFTIYPKVTLRATPSIGFLNMKVGDHTSYGAAVSSFSSISTSMVDVVQVTAVHASGGASFRPATLQGNHLTSDNYIELKCEL